MKILTSLTIRAVSTLVVLLAGLGLVLDMGQGFSFKLMSTVGETALVSELAVSSQLPVLAHFSLVLSLVILDELVSFLDSVELSSLRSHIYFELGA
jgi:hypothetical protein